MNLTRSIQTPTRDYQCQTQVGSLNFRIVKEKEKTRVALLIRSGTFESKIMIYPRQVRGLRLLINDYFNHIGGTLDE